MNITKKLRKSKKAQKELEETPPVEKGLDTGMIILIIVAIVFLILLIYWVFQSGALADIRRVFKFW